jgi:hypothetical protein
MIRAKGRPGKTISAESEVPGFQKENDLQTSVFAHSR